MLKIKLKKFNFNKIFLILSFIYLVSAINNPIAPFDFSTIKSTIFFFRGIAPVILLPIFIFYAIFIKKKLKFNWVYFFFFLYLLFQITNSFYLNYKFLDQLYWVICAFSTLLFFYIIQNEYHFNLQILKIFILIIFIVALKFSFDLYFDYFSNYLSISQGRTNFYGYSTMDPNNLFVSQPVPRSSGLARMLLLMWILLLTEVIFGRINIKKKIFFYILLFILNFTIFQLQSRLIAIFHIAFFFFLILFPIYKLNYKKKIILLLLIFVAPYFFHIVEYKIRNTVQNYVWAKKDLDLITKKDLDYYRIDNNIETTNNKIDNINTDTRETSSSTNSKGFNLKDALMLNKNDLYQQRILQKHMSGRKELWTRTFKLVIENNFIGFGPQADRMLLNENVSGLYFYSLICGGIFSFLSIVILSGLLFLKCIKLLFFNKVFLKGEKFICFSLIIIGFLFVRTIGEISYGVFGIDMIIFFIAYNILSNINNSRSNL